jgi:Bacterial DNA-binding protein
MQRLLRLRANTASVCQSDLPSSLLPAETDSPKHHFAKLCGALVVRLSESKNPWRVKFGLPAELPDLLKENPFGSEFVLSGFGKLVKQKRKARTDLNPKTQQKMKIQAKTVCKIPSQQGRKGRDSWG